MDNNIVFRYSHNGDIKQITKLLEQSNLPSSDLIASNVKFIIAEKGQAIIACIGLEVYDTEGLLRSFAVEPSLRNTGIGNELLQYLQSFAKQLGIQNLHLLTTTAEKYFLKKRFVLSERNTAPDSIKNTTEFSTLCASSSTYMTYKNIEELPVLYHRDLHLHKVDEETQSNYWAISGEKLMFTYFEVEAGKTFSKHAHKGEQITHVLEGELNFEINNTIYRVSKGCSIVIPSNQPHKVWTNSHKAAAVDAWNAINKKYIST